jgi:hypothetical protein
VSHLVEQHAADIPGQVRNPRDRIADDLRKARDGADSRGHDVTELVEMRAQRVHGLGALLHELLPRPESHRPRLLVGGLRFYEPHGRPQGRLDDGLAIGRIVLLPFQEWPDGRWQTNSNQSQLGQ